jgi:rhodanese-related sulfurtransferase
MALALLATVMPSCRASSAGCAQKPMVTIDGTEAAVSMQWRADRWCSTCAPRPSSWARQGHIAGALNIPLEELAARQGELESGRGRAVLLVCTTDRRSSRAAALLAAAGFAQVQVVQGGMTAWRAKGWPVEGANPP